MNVTKYKWNHILTNSELQQFIKSLWWDESYLESIHLQSPSRVISAPNLSVSEWGSRPEALILMASVSNNFSATVMRFANLDQFDIWFEGDLCPIANISSNGFEWQFNPNSKIIKFEKFSYFNMNTHSDYQLLSKFIGSYQYLPGLEE